MTTIMPHTRDDGPSEEPQGYEGMSRDELKAELEARGLDTSGRSKAELIARLEENDAA